MAATAWKQWLASVRSSTPTWTYRQLAAAVEFTLRALDAAKLLDDVPSEQGVLETLAWPSGFTGASDRARRLLEPVPLGPLTAALAWLNTATRVLDDHSAPVGDWATMRSLLDGTDDVTRRLEFMRRRRQQQTPPPKPAPAPAPTPTAPAWKPIGPYGQVVAQWYVPGFTRAAAAEALRWLELQSKRAKLPAEVAYYYSIVGDAPDGPLPAGVAAQLVLAYRTLANDLDLAVGDGKVTAQGYSQPSDAWDYAQRVARAAQQEEAEQTSDVEPGVTQTDLPTTPPAPTPPPRPTTPPTQTATATPGPYVSAFNRFRVWAASTNGLDTDSRTPRMTREQSAAVLRYIVRQARTHFNADDPATKRWLPIALALLGWSKRGDKYRSDAPWRTGWTGLPTIAELWSYALDVCQQLDAQGVAFDGPHPQPTADYAVMMDEAAAAQLADDPTMPPPATPATPAGGAGSVPVTPSVPSVPIIPPGIRPPVGGGPGLGDLLLLWLAIDGLTS